MLFDPALASVTLVDAKHRTYSGEPALSDGYLPATIQPGQRLRSGMFDQPGIQFGFIDTPQAVPDHLVILRRDFDVPHEGASASGALG